MEEIFGYYSWYEDFNKCTSFAGKYGVSIANLLEWNPSLNEDNCEFEQAYSYFVVKKEGGLYRLSAAFYRKYLVH